MKNQIVKKIMNMATTNSPVILTGFGVAGLLGTVILAVKATPKAIQILEEERRVSEEELTKKDIVTLTWQCYIPAAIMGAVTIGCIVGANTINLRRNAALAGIYSLSEAALKEYKAKVVETLGETKERAIKDDIHKDRINNNPVNTNEIIVTGKGNTLCYDALGGRYFYSNMEHIRQVLNKLSRDMMSESYCTLNEVYSDLNLRGTKMGDSVGWHIDDGLIEPEFSSQLTEDGTPCLVLDYVIEPRYGYNNF